MKILMFGDSITDAYRNRETDNDISSYGHGYVKYVAGDLLCENPEKYEIINRGISGNRIVDLYARIKCDCWNLNPDFISILIGVNDVWHEIGSENGVEIDRFEKVYRMLIEDTKKALPNTKILLCEPFVLCGTATEHAYDKFLEVKEYAKVVKKLAEEYGLFFLPLQQLVEDYAKKHTVEVCLWDGVHPNIAGAKLIANAWVEFFKKEIDK